MGNTGRRGAPGNWPGKGPDRARGAGRRVLWRAWHRAIRSGGHGTFGILGFPWLSSAVGLRDFYCWAQIQCLVRELRSLKLCSTPPDPPDIRTKSSPCRLQENILLNMTALVYDSVGVCLPHTKARSWVPRDLR